MTRRNLAARRLRLQGGVAWQSRGAPPAGEAISQLRAWRLREPRSGRRYTVIRLTTAGGLNGYGETGEVTDRELESAKQAILGLAASAYEVAWRRLDRARALRAAVNMAQLDLMGKQARAPIYQLLGGPTRFKIRVMTVLDGEAALDRARNSGFRAFQITTPENPWRNAGKGWLDQVEALMNRLRSAAGPGCDFVLGGEGRLTPGDAQSLAARLERFHLLWFDEPVAANLAGAPAKIAAESVTPLGFGHALDEPGEFLDLLRQDAVDVLRPDLARAGITGCRRIAAVGETYYVAIAPFHGGGPIATAAALHLAASLPNFFIQQIPLAAAPEDLAMRRALAGDALEQVRDGFAALPAGPGLGIQVVEAALDRFAERAA